MDWNRLKPLWNSRVPRSVNVHLLTRPQDFPDIPPETQDPTHARRVLDIFLQDLGVLVERFGPQRVIGRTPPYYL